MYVKSTLLLTTFVAFAGGAIAAPVTQFAPRSVARATDTVRQSDKSGFMLVQKSRAWRRRSAGGRWWRPACRRRKPRRQFQQQQLSSGRIER